MKKVFFLVLLLLTIPGLFFIGFLFFMKITDVNPQPTIPLTTENNRGSSIQTNTPFSITTFNIGYGGLDQSQDFFLEGGKRSRPRSEEQTWENLGHMGKFLNEQDTDIIFLQEVNVRARRSFHINQLQYFSNILHHYSSTFGMNHQVKWVPVPLTNPIGDVYSGVLTLTKFYTNSSTRYQLPGKEKWLIRVFDLDRCFIVNRIPVKNGRELVLVNVHLSAYDKGGLIRKRQLDFLEKYITEEYKKENYVIVGGDWNHVIPGTKHFVTKEKTPSWVQNFPEDFTPKSFSWGSDRTAPTVRSNAFPYQKGLNFVTVIDGFLVSPNVKITEIKTHDLDFKHSDHNPVVGSFILKEDDTSI